MVHGDFGTSVQSTYDIGIYLIRSSVVTLRLVLVAMLLALVLAVIAGVVSAVKQYSKVDYTLTFFGFLFLAMPSFWLAILLKEARHRVQPEPTGSQVFYTIGDQTRSRHPDDAGTRSPTSPGTWSCRRSRWR